MHTVCWAIKPVGVTWPRLTWVMTQTKVTKNASFDRFYVNLTLMLTKAAFMTADTSWNIVCKCICRLVHTLNTLGCFNFQVSRDSLLDFWYMFEHTKWSQTILKQTEPKNVHFKSVSHIFVLHFRILIKYKLCYPTWLLVLDEERYGQMRKRIWA